MSVSVLLLYKACEQVGFNMNRATEKNYLWPDQIIELATYYLEGAEVQFWSGLDHCHHSLHSSCVSIKNMKQGMQTSKDRVQNMLGTNFT